MKNIAITGANGFIGQAIVRQLKDKSGINVTVLDRGTHNLLNPDSLKSFLENQDVIIHLAGVNRGTNYELVQVNTLGMLSLLEAVVKYAPTARIIFASTFQVYLPQNLYGLSKRFAEELLVQYGLNHKVQGTILRLSNVYGPGCKPFYNSVIATFAYQIKQGKTLRINGDGSQERDYVYVDDVAEAFIRVALNKQEEQVEIIDVCSGKSTSINNILDTIRKVYPKRFEVVYNSSVKEKPWPTKGKNFERAKKLLGWEPKTTPKEGLKQVMK